MKPWTTLMALAALAPASLAGAHAPPATVGDRTVALYRELLRQPRPPGWGYSKEAYLTNELDKYDKEESYGHPFVIPPGEVPRLVALRAIGLEIDDFPPLLPAERQAFARYPAAVRRGWSPLARRLWLEASYDWKTSDLPTVRTEIAVLRRLGQSLDALEAALIGQGRLSLRNAYAIADEILRYAEAHPQDVVASRAVTVTLYVPTFLAVDRKQPLRRDLLGRAFALEARTIRNQNALLGDDQAHLRTFDILRDTMNGKIPPRKGG